MIALIQRHLEAIYDIEAPDIRDFLVDEADVLALLGTSARVAREWVLVRQADDDVDIGVYLHADDISAVDARTPAEAVRDALPAWCTVTEGVSHFLLLVRRAAREETVSLLELETQAEVDKYVTARLHVGPDPTLRRRLFRDATLAEGLDSAERDRYREAGRLADRYCERLERHRDVSALLTELRGFYRRTGHARMDMLRRAA
ncbi:MAG: hypothetical protein Q7U06_01215 [Pseudomonadota bacterium]|nr:hypothetical protein [Pseudomonadota bacterium]